MHSLKTLSAILVTLFFLSCSQSLDFDQIEDYAVNPSIIAPLAYFTIDAANFLAFGGVTEISETSDFKVFENSFFKQNLTKLDFEFEVSNQFNRDFTMTIALLDDNNNLIYEFNKININANNLDIKQKEVIEFVVHQNIINFTRVKFTLSLDDASIPILASDLGDIEFKSAVIIYLEANL